MEYKDLSNEQQDMIKRAIEGKNVLVDACIGSGKTTAIQVLCNQLPNKSILYLTYNRLLKIDARDKIKLGNVFVTNYHGYAWTLLDKIHIHAGTTDLIQTFNRNKPYFWYFDLLVIDEYQDIEQELAEMLEILKEQNPNMQIVAVGDMQQKIYDKTTLDVQSFINQYLGEYETVKFTKCFRLNKEHAAMLGRIWNKEIDGVNEDCKIEFMGFAEAAEYLSKQDPKDVLCLGARNGIMPIMLNHLESRYPEKYNKKTVYATIRTEDQMTAPSNTSAIFTTYDSSKGLERKICVIFNYTMGYWNIRSNMPMTKYDILRNIFCVAASRGKEKIIFVEDPRFENDPMLSEEVLAKTTKTVQEFRRPFAVSEMFDFKYKEDVEECFSLIKKKKKRRKDKTQIYVKNQDGLIDLSPCIGIYQEAFFFDQYNIDTTIADSIMIHDDKKRPEIDKNASVERKILELVAFETGYDRYKNQVDIPFVTEVQTENIVSRMATIFSHNEKIQQECSLTFYKERGSAPIFIKGRVDVLKNNAVYELKFVSELKHEHFLQCACYMICLNLKKGFLWNIQNNEMYEISIPDRERFLDAVVKTITKGLVPKYIAG